MLLGSFHTAGVLEWIPESKNGRRSDPAPVCAIRAALVYSAGAGLGSAFGAGAECLAEISTTIMQITVKIAEV